MTNLDNFDRRKGFKEIIQSKGASTHPYQEFCASYAERLNLHPVDSAVLKTDSGAG